MHSKRPLFCALLVALGIIAAGCASSELSEEAANIVVGECVDERGEAVTIYSGRTENLISPILEAFTCETGVEVNVRWGSSTDLAVLINEEGERSNADVFLSRSPGPVGFLEGNGLLGTLDDETLSLVSSDNQAASGSWVGFSGRQRVLVYNVDTVDDTELPDSVLDLTEEQYRGRVAVPATNGSFEDWFTVFRDQFGTEVATQWLDDMVANDAQPYANNRAIVEATGRGEIDFGLVNHYYNFQESAARGDQHRGDNYNFLDDDIGSLLIITAAAVLEQSTNQEPANELIRYLLDTPAQQYFTDTTFEYPLASNVAPNPALPPLTGLEVGSIDFDSLGGGFQETTRIIEESGILNQ